MLHQQQDIQGDIFFCDHLTKATVVLTITFGYEIGVVNTVQLTSVANAIKQREVGKRESNNVKVSCDTVQLRYIV